MRVKIRTCATVDLLEQRNGAKQKLERLEYMMAAVLLDGSVVSGRGELTFGSSQTLL